MGYKTIAGKQILSEWGEVLGRKVFGNKIPTNVKSILGNGSNSISKMDALTFSQAIDLDKEVQEPLSQLLRNAGDGDDTAFGILANAAKDFQIEDQGVRILNQVKKRINVPVGEIPNRLPTTTGREILSKSQIANPSTKRAPSIPPNLPQEVIEEYTKEATPRLRAGERNRTDIPYLIDENNRIFRLDQQGWEYVRTSSGDNVYQKKYGLIDVELKRARNAKLNKVRQQKVNLTTKAGTDQRDFYNDPDITARHETDIEDPHHRAPLHPSSKLKQGLTIKERAQVDTLLDTVGIVLGNSKFNRDNLPKAVHKKLHSWLKRNKLLLGNIDMSTLSMRERMKYLNQFIEEMKKSDQKTYKLMQAFMRLNKIKGKV